MWSYILKSIFLLYLVLSPVFSLPSLRFLPSASFSILSNPVDFKVWQGILRNPSPKARVPLFLSFRIKVISDSGYRTDLRNEASAKTGRQLAEIPFVKRKMESVSNVSAILFLCRYHPKIIVRWMIRFLPNLQYCIFRKMLFKKEASAKTGRQLAEIPFVKRKMESVSNGKMEKVAKEMEFPCSYPLK